ncbi:extracellular solute-binding protein [Pseudobacteroides cellulosolvens]|uniref:Copper amine oxidase-like domain-containing protein n=1 Tax=Pseudobacteroides cellulosolvens ATCC 35603 = DSM 2933 TaxID=398512 RepID=A0A0L6JV98_9FIRM|nr:extracellular solute-binding protein [Pseudobacteroides cellulosolvens]KNY29771.1 copper amine oxidase-like domain-containing protein [Pseudobacteroides cellulosolvens ATCC 35603 = DSM 2933]
MKRSLRVLLGVFVISITCIAAISIVWSYNTVRKIEAIVNDNIKIYLDDEEQVLKETDGSKISPVIINGRTYLPLRPMADLAGFGVEWDDRLQEVLLSSDKTKGRKYSKVISRNKKGELTFWHFNKDEMPEFVKAFNEAYPNIKVNAVAVTDKDYLYQNRLISRIRAHLDVPDVFSGEAAFIKQFVEMTDAFADITDRAKDYVGNMIPYTVEMGTDKNGVLRAVSPIGAPGALAYKKDAAKKYLGTDDPLKISEMLSTRDKMIAAAQTLKEKSKGKVALFPTFEEPLRMFMAGRSKGWVTDGKLTIDQKALDFIDFAKDMRDNKYEATLDQWSPDWSAAIADDEKALVWACPSWGIPWIIGSNDKQAANGGRWGLARPGIPYFWNGTWLGIYSKSENQDIAWEFVKYFTTNEDLMRKWAHESKDFPNNLQVIAEGYGEENKIMGIDIYKFYEPFIKDIDGSIFTEYDSEIQNIYTNNLGFYLNGGEFKTKDELIKAFKNRVKNSVVDITVE